MASVRKSSGAYRPKGPDGRARFQHWYRDNQVYFITARCRARYPAFATDQAKAVFWEQFDKYTTKHQFTPWVTSLLDNHWHTIGYLKVGRELGPMMNGIQGATAKLVNDILHQEHKAGRISLPPAPPANHNRPTLPGTLTPFWYDSRSRNYFDGCLRDELQATRTYQYVLTQCVRHRMGLNPDDYVHTRIDVPLRVALPRATKLHAFLYDVPYRRYGQT